MRERIVELLKNTKERIIGQDRYVNSAVLIAIAEFEGKEYIVLEKRAVEIRQGGEISLPGGKCDKKDKNSEETAIRETIEELGIPREKIEVTGKLGILVNPSGMILEVYVGFVRLENREDIKYNRDEVERVIFAPIEFFLKNEPRIEKIGIKNVPQFSTEELGLPKRYHGDWQGNPREVYFYNFHGDIVWGMTAEIILDFIKMLRKDTEVVK